MSTPKVVSGDAAGRLEEQAVLAAVRSAFTELGGGRAVQPVQVVTPFPDGGDVIVYQAVLPEAGVYALKMSPYLPRSGASATVTAWTMLVSLETGDPVLLIDAKALTAHRTAATSVLAVDLLASSDATRLAVIGAGPLARAHVRYARQVRPFEQVSVFAPGTVDPAVFAGDVTVCDTAASAVADADVVMLCTSAAEPVIDIAGLPPGTVVTSISTNAPRAHEIDPAALSQLDVYCDFRPAAMAAAGDFVIAADEYGFSIDGVRGDLPGLLVGRDDPPSGTRPVFFRSVGLGIEDAAVALVALERLS